VKLVYDVGLVKLVYDVGLVKLSICIAFS